MKLGSMRPVRRIIILILSYDSIICNSAHNESKITSAAMYKGESFPKKYLLPEETVPSVSDLQYYINNLERTVKYFFMDLLYKNDTDVNDGLGMYFMKSVLKRVVRDYQSILSRAHLDALKKIIKMGDTYVSFYVYITKEMSVHSDDGKLEYRVARVLKDDAGQVYSIGEFSKGRLKKWILSDIPMHSYIELMDNKTLPREQYAKLIDDMDLYFIKISHSDQGCFPDVMKLSKVVPLFKSGDNKDPTKYRLIPVLPATANCDRYLLKILWFWYIDECLSRIVYNPEPIRFSELRPCRPDGFCRKAILSSPSSAYALSHRLLNLVMYRHARRCFFQSQKEDDDMINTLCAFMYREAVYIARLGFFAKDIFLEHVALCSLMGYEEFHRHHWYRKVASWIDDQGCIYETHNLLMNRTRVQMQDVTDIKKQKRLRKKLKLHLLDECHKHPMILLTIVLAQAIRHTLHFMR